MNADLLSGWLSSRAARLLALGLIVLLGAYLRFGAAAFTVVDSPIRADAAQYVAYAYNLRLHDTYSRQIDALVEPGVVPRPDALRSPGYPLFLYPFTWSADLDRFGKDVVFAQAAISTATIVIVYVVATPVVGPAWALGVALLTAVSPHLVTINTYLLSEALFTFGIAIALLLTWRAQVADRRSAWLLAGLVLGWAALVRPTLLYFVPFLALFIAFGANSRTRARDAVLLTLGFLFVIGSWVLRNWLVLGVAGDNTLTISTLHHGMYPGFVYEGHPESFGFPNRFDPDAARIGASMGSVVAAIVERFQGDFWGHAAWYAEKPLWLFRWGIIAGQGDVFVYPTLASPYYDQAFFKATRQFMYWLHAVLVWLAFGGAALAWLPQLTRSMPAERLFMLRLISVAYIYFIFVHVIGAPFPRYSIPIRPLTYILALAPVALLPSWCRRYRTWCRLGATSAPLVRGGGEAKQ